MRLENRRRRTRTSSAKTDETAPLQPDDSRLQALAAQKLAPVGTFAPAIRTLLAPHGLTLAFLDIDSDSYPLVLLPDTQLASAQQLAAQCRKRIIMLTENT